MQAKSGDPDQTPHFAVSGLGLHYLPTSHKKNAWLIWVYNFFFARGNFCCRLITLASSLDPDQD